MNTKDFLIWEQATRDTIDFKKVYVDVAEDLIGGLLLSQIVYWNLPGQMGKTKLRVQIDDELWLAKGREEWWDECRISAKQFDRAIKILEGKGVVTTMLKKFNGFPTKHIKLNLDVLVEKLGELLKTEDLVEFPQRVKRNFPKGKNGFSPKGKKEFPQRVKSITENTTEIKKTKTTNNNNKKEDVVVVEEETKANELIKEKLDVKLTKKEIKTIVAGIKEKYGAFNEDVLIRALHAAIYYGKTIHNLGGFINKAIAEDYAIKSYKHNFTSNSDSSFKNNDLKFNNFEQREYDYKELEKKLLGWDSE